MPPAGAVSLRPGRARSGYCVKDLLGAEMTQLCRECDAASSHTSRRRGSG